MSDEPTFEIPARPERRFPRGGGVEYEGGSVFVLSPTPERSDERLGDLVDRVLDDDRYTSGDWFDLPMPLYLVHDGRTDDVFRVAVRDGAVELHVLPETGSTTLRALYDRLRGTATVEWSVSVREGG